MHDASDVVILCPNHACLQVKTELKWQPRFTNLDESLRTAWRWSKQAKY